MSAKDEEVKRLNATPCTCERCCMCNGSGRLRVPTGGYPEWDLESCDDCRGTGITDDCARCMDLYELTHEEDWG